MAINPTRPFPSARRPRAARRPATATPAKRPASWRGRLHRFRRGGAAGACLALFVVMACTRPADPELVARFRATCERLAAGASAAGTQVVTGGDGWYFSAEETAALGAATPRSGAAVAEIAAAAERLRGEGIQLVVAPVPPKGIIYPDRLAPELDVPIPVRRLDATLQAVYGDLQAQGVRLVDLTPAFIRDRFHHEGPLYCRQDSHWSGVGCVVAAEIIGATVRELGEIAAAATQPYGLAWFTTPIRGDLWQRLPETPPHEEIRTRGVIEPEDPLHAPVAPGGDAPVAVVGDTHALVFHGGEPYHARGAGVADQLAFEFRQPVALHARDGSAPDDDTWRLPTLGGQTRVVIWIFAATRLLGGA
jgi:hypothetical protein